LTPSKRTIRDDLQPSLWSDWTLDGVRSVLGAHEDGDFRDSAQLVEAMGRDDRVDAVLRTRVQAILGLPFEMLPAEGRENQRGKSVAKLALAHWYLGSPESVIGRFLTDGIQLGVSIGEITWRKVGRSWAPMLRPKNMQHVRYRWDVRRYELSTPTGPVLIEPGTGDWFVYEPYGERSWMGGAVRALAIPWLVRQYAVRDWARFNEIHGSPARKVKVPAGLEGPDRDLFRAQMANPGREMTLFLPQNSDGTGADVELLEATNGDGATFDKLITSCNVSIAVRLLGQNLTTEVQGGSYAAANMHDRVRQDYAESDVETMTTQLHAQVWEFWAEYNLGNVALAPFPAWQTTPPEDAKTKAEVLDKSADALGKLLAQRLPVDLEKWCETFGIELTKGAPLPELPEAAPEPAVGPDGKPVDVPAEGADGAEDAPVLNEAPLGNVVSLAAVKASPGIVDGQDFVDGQVDAGIEEGARAFAPDLAIVLDAIEASSSYADLRKRLRTAYRDMPPSELAGLLERAVILAELAGRHSVLTDL
jgi:phage gp29-like protein